MRGPRGGLRWRGEPHLRPTRVAGGLGQVGLGQVVPVFGFAVGALGGGGAHHLLDEVGWHVGGFVVSCLVWYGLVL